MAYLNCSRDSWNAVKDPETDEYVSVDERLTKDQAQRLAEEYEQITVREESQSDDTSSEDDDSSNEDTSDQNGEEDEEGSEEDSEE